MQSASGRGNATALCAAKQTQAPYFRIYKQYVAGYSKYAALVAGWREQKAVNKFLEEQRAKEPALDGASLETFLLMPMKRLPRYSILLRELMDCTPTEHIDYQSIGKALTQVKEVRRSAAAASPALLSLPLCCRLPRFNLNWSGLGVLSRR